MISQQYTKPISVFFTENINVNIFFLELTYKYALILIFSLNLNVQDFRLKSKTWINYHFYDNFLFIFVWGINNRKNRLQRDLFPFYECTSFRRVLTVCSENWRRIVCNQYKYSNNILQVLLFLSTIKQKLKLFRNDGKCRIIYV